MIPGTTGTPTVTATAMTSSADADAADDTNITDDDPYGQPRRLVGCFVLEITRGT